MNNERNDMISWLEQQIGQLDIKIKEFRAKFDPNKRKVTNIHLRKALKRKTIEEVPSRWKNIERCFKSS